MRSGGIRTSLAAAGLAALVLAACGKAATPSAGGTSGAPARPVTTTSAPPASSNGGGRYGDVGGTGGSASGQGSGASAAAALKARSIAGVGNVLTNSKGLTLYDLPSEANGGPITCTGSCASLWPPLLVVGGKLPALPAGVSGTVAKVTRPDGGVQVTYNGKPLYLWEGDSAPGQATGVGIEGFEAVTVP